MFVINKLAFLLLVAAIASPPTEACGFGVSFDGRIIIQMFEDLAEATTEYAHGFINGLKQILNVGRIITQMLEDLPAVTTEYTHGFINGLKQMSTVRWVILVAAILLLFWAAFTLMGCLDKTDSVKKVAGQIGKAKRDTNISNIQDRGDDTV